MRIEVAYGGPEGQWLIELAMPEEATVQQAIDASGLADHLGMQRLALLKPGIASKVVDGGTRLRANDRVELYRPLRVDPRSARRERVERARGTRR